jgi:hypothetical protein
MLEAQEPSTPHKGPGGDKYKIEYERYWINWSQMELYKVKDKAGNILYHAKRRGTFGKWLASSSLVVVPLLVVALIAFQGHRLAWSSMSGSSQLILLASCIIVGIFPFVLIMLKPRHMLVYPGESHDEPILRIIHRKPYKAIIGTYAVETPAGEFLGYLRCNHLLGLLRTKMKCHGPDGSLLCTIVEPFTVTSVVFLILDLVLSSSGSGGRWTNDSKILEPAESRIIGKFSRDTIELAPEARIDGRFYLSMGLLARSQFGP